jgi:hypothetical protein
MNIVSTSTVRWVPETMLPLVARQVMQQYVQSARIAASAIGIGLFSLSYGIASLGLDTLKELAIEITSGGEA